MRVTINAELLEGKADPRACHGVGEVVDPCDGREQTSPASCPHNCTAANVVTASKAAFVKERFGWLRGKVSRLLKVNPVTDEVTFRPSSRHLYTPSTVASQLAGARTALTPTASTQAFTTCSPDHVAGILRVTVRKPEGILREEGRS